MRRVHWRLMAGFPLRRLINAGFSLGSGGGVLINGVGGKSTFIVNFGTLCKIRDADGLEYSFDCVDKAACPDK